MKVEICKFYTYDGEPSATCSTQTLDTEEHPAISIRKTGDGQKIHVLLMAEDDGTITVTMGVTTSEREHPEHGMVSDFVVTDSLASLREHDKPFVLFDEASEQDHAGYVTVKNLGSVVPDPTYN